MNFGFPQPKPYLDWYTFSSLYALPSNPNRRSTSYNVPPLSSYTFTPSDSAAPYAPSAGGSAHLDAVTDSLAVKPSQDPLDTFFSAKRTFLGKSVEDILGSIYERISLKYENLHQLEYQSIRLGTRLLELNNCNWGMNPQIERVRINLEREILSTDTEKRNEEVECWRDVTRLKTELREVLREFSQEKQKSALFGDASTNPWTYNNSAGH
ncbi:MAG: hypothetical protein HUU46_19290 [Candidatus Hydrogenedentes bacterium]|nr:hypothetical protein [Candidatus Hydrogenedentota bacterium]